MLVAFYSHGSRAGKDTAGFCALEWAEEQGIAMTKYAFADAMKFVVARALGITDIDDTSTLATVDTIKLNGTIVTQTPAAPNMSSVSGRDFIIGIAEGIRQLDHTFWIRNATGASQEQMRLLSNSSQHLVLFTDLRFQTEADYINEMGGYVIEIQRPGMPRFNEDRIDDPSIFDVVHNDDTLPIYDTRVHAMLCAVAQHHLDTTSHV